MSYQRIIFDLVDGIGTVTLNHPPTLNGLSLTMQEELRDVIARVHAEREIRALILTGAGRAFCTGAALDGLQSSAGATLGQSTGQIMRDSSNPLVLALRELPVPLVTAMNGPAAGAGASLALCGDLVLAAKSASFVLTFAPALGIVPDLGMSWNLPRMIGRARANALTLLGEKLPAQSAAEWGLIHAAVDDAELANAARALAQRLARMPAHAALEVRRAFDRGQQSSLEAALDYEAGRQLELIDRESFGEGVRAFFERREPTFAPR